MNSIHKLCLLLLFQSVFCFAQIEKEVVPPFNIKTVSFVDNGDNLTPIFELGDTFQLQFDDLFGNEANYYYQIVHCDYDWKPSQLTKNEYLIGFDDQRIQTYRNSFNTLQMYSHYTLSLPNKYTQLRVSGNYMLKILNENRELVFSRKFIVFENLVSVPLQIKRARNNADYYTNHNLDFAIRSQNILFQSPLQNVKVLLMQNGQFNGSITNVKPMYTLGNDLIYKYDVETQFWGGNEFLNFDNKNIKAPYNNISFVDAKDIYNSHLYTNSARGNLVYTYFPDTNGNFVVSKQDSQDNEVEADYAWVFFSLSAPSYFSEKGIYVTGMFNNYALVPEYKMDYNKETGLYEKAIIIKQGYTNFQYTIADSKGVIDAENAVDGNFWQTENNYSVIVYYRENGKRYDRVIGRGFANSANIIN